MGDGVSAARAADAACIEAEDMAIAVMTMAKAVVWLISEIEAEAGALEESTRSDGALTPFAPLAHAHASHVRNIATALYALADEIAEAVGGPEV